MKKEALRWIDGNKFTLLENGEEFFPRVFAAIEAAQKEILIETFILYEDKVGNRLGELLIAAGKRGVQVDVTVDAFGSLGTPALSDTFAAALAQAGVRLHVFDPASRFFNNKMNYFRRLHRKLVVVDGARGFVGGINYSADHVGDFGPEAKQDYATEVEGPIVAHIHRFMLRAIAEGRPGRRWYHWRLRKTEEKPLAELPQAGNASAMFVTRDNSDHQRDIERHYRLAIRLAKKRIVIANAYFFPGYSFLRDVRDAARRGVEVSLILQGNPDMAIVKIGANMLYDYLLDAGVRIYEYCDRPLHGKVALVDDEWSTVGSSNLDPLSLALNLEANVMIRDRDFNAALSANLDKLMRESCKQITPHDIKDAPWWRQIRNFVVFHFLRRYPNWAGWLPAHAPRLSSMKPADLPEGADRVKERKAA